MKKHLLQIMCLLRQNQIEGSAWIWKNGEADYIYIVIPHVKVYVLFKKMNLSHGLKV